MPPKRNGGTRPLTLSQRIVKDRQMATDLRQYAHRTRVEAAALEARALAAIHAADALDPPAPGKGA